MEFKPLSGRLSPRFAAIKTFFRLPHVSPEEGYDVGIFGIPSDVGVSYRPGARFAPAHVRESSSLGRGFHWNRGVNLFEKLKVADIGDCPVTPLSLDQTMAQIETYVLNLLKLKKKFIAVGGDHSNTLPILRALKKHYGKPLAFIHFDAHLDTYPAAWGCEYHHGAFARHAVEEGLVDPQKMLQIGLRGPLATAEDLDFVTKNKIKTITIDDIRAGHLNDFLKKLPSFDSTPTYLSFDVDCLDPAFAPGTGTPVPGGLTTYEAQKILQNLKIPNLVGADLMEICPAYDSSDITALAGVDVLFESLCLMAHLEK
ncbi:MAG: agmatinase [Bdellovibrionota bacterium]